MANPSHLDDPAISSFAWNRYKKLMLWMALASTASAVLAIGFLYWRNPDAPVFLFIAAAGGVFASVMLGAALMGLVFLSSGTGHDESIEDRLEEERNRP